MKDELVYPREISLGAITLVLGLIGWLLIVVGTFGLALIYLLFGFVFYVFAHSAFISWLRGNAVLLSQAQLPDLRARFEACCKRLGIEEPPEAYLMQGGGALNAFATRFLGRNYVVLLSDIFDAITSPATCCARRCSGCRCSAPPIRAPRNRPATGTAGRAARRPNRRRAPWSRWPRAPSAGSRSTCPPTPARRPSRAASGCRSTS